MIIKVQAFRFCTCLDKSKKMDSGRIKIIGWIAIFLLPKVEAGEEFCAKLKGSNKYCNMPITAITPAARINPHESFIKLLFSIDKLVAKMKLEAAISQRSHFVTVKSKLTLQKTLHVPKTNNRRRVNLI
jgi:hypothetical protein